MFSRSLSSGTRRVIANRASTRPAPASTASGSVVGSGSFSLDLVCSAKLTPGRPPPSTSACPPIGAPSPGPRPSCLAAASAAAVYDG
jgi:hypothetical protein